MGPALRAVQPLVVILEADIDGCKDPVLAFELDERRRPYNAAGDLEMLWHLVGTEVECWVSLEYSDGYAWLDVLC